MDMRALLVVVLLVALASPGDAAVGHGSTGATLAKMTADLKPGAAANTAGEAAGWSGGILALEGIRRLVKPLSTALSSGLASILPPGIARATAGIATELVSGAAFKVGMDAGTDLLTTGSVRKPDWLEVGAAAVGMVAGGLLGKPLGPIGEAIGSWLGWSLGENLVRNYRDGKGWDLFAAAKDIDLPRLALQAVATEGAGLLARPLVASVLGMGGAAGSIASIAVQIGLTVGAAVVARKVGDAVLGPEDEGDEKDLATLENDSRQAYRRFVEASRNPSAGQETLAKALSDYKSAQSALASAKAAQGQ